MKCIPDIYLLLAKNRRNRTKTTRPRIAVPQGY